MKLASSEIEKLVRACREGAVAVYGSRVAGYAKPESDYDLLVAVKGLKERARYIYKEFEGLNLSILMVDRQELIEDALEARLGEFAAGRLLNPYLPLTDGDYWSYVEREIKKRVMVEEFGGLVDELGRMSLYVLVPLKFFLFSKLKKRAAMYPPALYSYVKTYGGSRGEENLKLSLEGFRKAAEELMAEGVIWKDGEFYRLTREGFKALRRPSYKRTVSRIKRSITHYFVHGLAGKVGLDVVFKEAYSKIVRTQELHDIPPLLKEPRECLRLEEGSLVVKGGWIEEVSRVLGLRPPLKTESGPIGSFYSTTYLYRLRDRKREEKVVVKRFLDLWSVKWIFVGMFARPVKSFKVRPMARLENEYVASLELRKLGIGTAPILVVSLDEKSLVKGFLEGKKLEKAVDRFYHDGEGREEIALFCKALSKAHSAGYCIGDTKPENVLIKEGKVYFIDLEQAQEGGDQAWDVAEFIYYSCLFAPDAAKAEALARVFVENYEFKKDVLKKASEQKYALPFMAIIRPGLLDRVMRVLKEAS